MNGKDEMGKFDPEDRIYELNEENEERIAKYRLEERRKSRRKITTMVSARTAAVALVVCMAVSSAFGFAGGVAAQDLFGQSLKAAAESTAESAALSTQDDSAVNGVLASAADGTEGNLTIVEIAKKTADSVVEITTETVTKDRYMQQYVEEGAGSGVIVSEDGYIATNNHVISGASKITVRLKNGTSYQAVLIGTDATTDVALLKITATGLTPATFGDSSKLQVGELAVAVGNPLGQLGGTVTDGIISALNREIIIDGKSMNLMQTNAAINPGNSGGGLFNGKGELVGLVVAKSAGSGVEGLGFAIPANDVKTVIDALKTNGYVQGRIDLGMTTVEVSSLQQAMMYGVRETGLYVGSVTAGSNAAQAGFQVGDRIASVGGTKITTEAQLNKALKSYKVGDTVTVDVMRGSSAGQLTLKLAEYIPTNASV